MHHAIQVWHLGKWVRKAAPWQPLPAHCCESFVQWEAVGFVSAAVGAQCTWWVNAGLAALRDWPSAHCSADGKNGSCLRAQMSLWLMYFNLKTFAECISAFAGILKPNTWKRGKCPSLSIFGITLVRISWKKQSSSDFFLFFASSFTYALPCQKSCAPLFPFFSKLFVFALFLDTVCFLMVVQAEVRAGRSFQWLLLIKCWFSQCCPLLQKSSLDIQKSKDFPWLCS